MPDRTRAFEDKNLPCFCCGQLPESCECTTPTEKLLASHKRLLTSLEWSFGILDVMLNEEYFVRAMESLNLVSEPNRMEARDAIEQARKVGTE